MCIDIEYSAFTIMANIYLIKHKSKEGLIMKTIDLDYGKEKIEISLPKNYKLVEKNKEESMEIDWESKKKEAFKNPVDSLTLSTIAKREQPDKVVILVNDITRPVPYDIVLKPMLKELKNAGVSSSQITLLIATGMHRSMTVKEVRKSLGKEIANNYRWENHKCDKKVDFVDELSQEIPFYINPLVQKADLLCSVGIIAPHYMAGFSGGGKSVFPGVCGRETIEKHHSLMVLPESQTANLEGNKFHQVIMEAADLVDLRFISNVVVDSKNELVDLVTGDYMEAWKKGVEICRENSVIEVDKRADIVIVSAGGFPKDINMYQAQKALENASYCVKKSSPILLIAECREGFGEKTFENWLNEATSPAYLTKKINDKFELGGHKAYAVGSVAAKNPLYLYSNLNKEQTKQCFMTPVQDINQFIADNIKDDLVYIMPHGANTVPVCDDDNNNLNPNYS